MPGGIRMCRYLIFVSFLRSIHGWNFSNVTNTPELKFILIEVSIYNTLLKMIYVNNITYNYKYILVFVK